VVGKSINTNAETAWQWMCQQESFDLLELAAASPLKLANLYLVVRRWLASAICGVCTRSHSVSVFRFEVAGTR